MKKIYSLVLILLLVFSISFIGNNVSLYAADGKVENQGATYRVKNKVEECDLGYGVKYQRDIAYSSVKTGHAIGGNAGSYGSTGTIVSNQEYLQQVNWLEIGANSNAKLIPYASVSGGYWNIRTVRNFAAEYESKHPGQMVIAAVNGDWFAIGDDCKASVGVTISNGEYYKSFSDYGVDSDTLVIDNNAKGKRLSDLSYNNIEPVLTIYDKEGKEVLKIKIDKVNEDPVGNEIALYYANRVSRADDYYYRFVNVKVNNAWVSESPSEAISVIKDTFYGKGTVKKIDSEYEISQGKFAIKTNNPEVLSLLSDDTLIRCQYEYDREDLKSIENAICFPYEVVVNGKEVYPENTGMHTDAKTRKPRTMIGQKEDGTIFLAQVDGRNANDNRFGMCQMEMAALLQYYGCEDAWKFDGGGSSTMIIRKQSGFKISEAFNDTSSSDWYVVNSPSDGSERNDGNCLLVVVDVPETKLEVSDISFGYIEFYADILTLKENYEELYLYLDGKKYLVENNKVKIDKIKASQEYEFYLYGKSGENYNYLGKRMTVVGALAEPTTAKVYYSIVEKDNQKQIQIYFNINNKQAIQAIHVEYNGKVYKSYNSYLTIEPDGDIFDLISNMEIKVIIETSKLLEEKTLVFNNPEFEYTVDFAYFEILFKNNDFIKSMFE